MFALPTYALAEGATADGDENVETRVDLNLQKFAELVVAANKGLYVEMGSNFMLNYTYTEKGVGEDAKDVVHEWLKEANIVKDLFPGINYQLLPDEEDVEDTDENKHTVTYKPGEHAKLDDEEKAPSDVTEEILKTKHVTLKDSKTFEAAEGYEFVGWLVNVTYDGKDSSSALLYREGDKFVMPDHDVEVTAYWYEKEAEEDADDKSDEAAGAAEGDKMEFAYPVNDIICLEYITPSDDPKDAEDWKRVAIEKEIEISSSGWWMFRLAVVDGEKGDISDKDAVVTPYNTKKFQDKILEQSKEGEYDWEAFCLYRYAVDTKHPEVALSSSMQSKMEDGLTVGTNYTILTNLSITDSSSTSTTYKVYRHKGNGTSDKTSSLEDWDLIYDSTADVKVVEGFEKYITSAGVITPVAADLTSSPDVYRYRIVYSVKDANGYFGIEKDSDGTTEFHPELFLGVKLSKEGVKDKQRIEAWKIVLFVIAGLSAVGIVVLLCIKPKQVLAGDTRVSEVEANTTNTVNDTVEQPTAEQPVEEPVVEEPTVEQPVEEPTVEEPVENNEVTEEPAEEATEQPTDEKPDDAE